MIQSTAAVLAALFLAVPTVHAEQRPTDIRTSIGKATVQLQPASPLRQALRQAAAPRRIRHDGAVVAGLAVLGLVGGMLGASRVALPCHCDDPESVVARGGLVGAGVGAAVGLVITLR